jgi:YHS domain-containing protein
MLPAHLPVLGPVVSETTMTPLASLSALLVTILAALQPAPDLGIASAQDAAAKAIARQGAPYLLDVCAVSGEALPEDGGVVLVFDGGGDALQAGREFRFCCEKCLAAFQKDPKKFIKGVDERIIADQLPRYPKSATCLVMKDEVLPDPTGPEAKDCKLVVVRNRLVRLCCGKCVRAFERDPGKFLPALDEIVIAEAKLAGTQTVCPVSERELGDRAAWFVVGDRAVGVCCGGCKGKVEKNPRKYVLGG